MTDSDSARGEVSTPSDPSPDSLDASPSLTLEDASADAPRRRGVVIGAVVASLLVVGAVGAVGAKLALGGGGKQPAEVLPREAVGYIRVDLDPSAGQKIAAFRLLDKLPDTKLALADKDLTLSERGRHTYCVIHINHRARKRWAPWW
jgi:hypothetical protein